MSTVLLVEDDDRLRRALRAMFRTDHFSVLEAPSGEDALPLIANNRPDLVVLDLRLPGLDGLETLRMLRSFSGVPVLVLTVRDNLRDKITALESGADDYVVKPFEPRELLARARAHLRRSACESDQPAVLNIGTLTIDLVRRQVTDEGQPVLLTPTEHRLLEVLVANRGRLLTREELLERVWGPGRSSDLVRLRVAVVSLRRKLRDDAANPHLISTEPGLGYRWIGGEDEPSVAH
jgi:two-component system KDP operon response regulator KdpE